MASLNTSTNGPAITSSHQRILSSPPPTSNSPTHAMWALFSVSAPLQNAFAASSTSESVLKVSGTDSGDLAELIEDFNDGRIQFAFVKVKDPNTGLPKNVLIGWCGEGVPERTKGYFTQHLRAVERVLGGYHVQITARSDRDLTADGIVQKVADASGSRYSGDTNSKGAAGPPPPIASKPTMPTKSFGGAQGFQPTAGRARGGDQAVDSDGWGRDAPQVSRSQLEKVQSAYQPTKVDMAALQSQPQTSRYQPPPSNGSSGGDAGVVKGGYQPIGKVDINALRQQAQTKNDDRPTVVKGAYEPIGKVDIADIRRRAQGAPPPSQPSPNAEESPQPKSLADRSGAFQQQPQSTGRLTSLPRPQVSNRFGNSTSSFSGTKAPTPGQAAPAPAAPVGAASRTFADQGGKTPAQQWEEKRRARGLSGAADTIQPSHSGAPAPTSPIASQPSGGWQSQYGGKKWGVQMPSRTGGSLGAQKTGEEDEGEQQQPVGSIADRYKEVQDAPTPPKLDQASKPNAGAARGMPMPGLPQRPQQPVEEDDEEEEVPAQQRQVLSPPPARPQPADEPEEEEDDEAYAPQGSPPRIAMPVARGASPVELEKAESLPPRPLPTASLEKAISHTQDADPEDDDPDGHDAARGAAQAAAASTFGQNAPQDTRGSGSEGGKTAIAQFDYEKAEENELELREGERVSGIEMVDEDWWMGVNEKGERGLFPANYVELVGGGGGEAEQAREETPPPPAQAPRPAAAPAAAAPVSGKTATAQYEYEAAEDNELSFPDGATVTGVVSYSPLLVCTVDGVYADDVCRSSRTKIGGLGIMAGRAGCSLLIMWSWSSRRWAGPKSRKVCRRQASWERKSG